jgi:hypothetical protein
MNAGIQSPALTGAPVDRLSVLAVEIRQAHAEVEQTARRSFEAMLVAGDRLIEAKVLLKHGQWRPWLREHCKIPPRTASLYMDLARNRPTLERARQNGNVADLSVRGALAVIAVDKTTAALCSSASVEWYTPAEILDLVREVFGTIDLDPCWHPHSLVRAARTYSAAADGLSRRWSGKVFLNPPYGRVIDKWVAKLVEEHAGGRVPEAIAVLPARTDTAWFQRLDVYPRVFVHGRLRFVCGQPRSGPASSPTLPTAIFYLGPQLQRFARIFESVGPTYIRYQRHEATAR